MKITKIIGGSIAVAAALALSVQAQNLLVNGSFEDAGGFTANPVAVGGVNGGWALFDYDSAQSDMFSSPGYPPEDGAYALIEQNEPGRDWNPAGAYQIIGGPEAVPGVAYVMSAWFLTDTTISTPIGPVDIQVQFLNSSLQNLLTYESGWIGSGIPMNTWVNNTFTTGLTPDTTAYVSVYLMFMDANQIATENMYFDNASLTVAPAPEPSTLALLGMGLAVPFYFIRRKKS